MIIKILKIRVFQVLTFLRGRTANFRGPASSQLYISGGGGVHREKKINPYDHT